MADSIPYYIYINYVLCREYVCARAQSRRALVADVALV
jgi:hypothetical protein